MPLLETLPVGEDCAQWQVWGTLARVVVTDPTATSAARTIVEDVLAAVDGACSRFRPDSELVRACRSGGTPVPVSPLLAGLVSVALRAANETDGDVDPTVGAAMCRLGYDEDLRWVTLNGRPGIATDAPAPMIDWRQVRLDGSELTVPDGVQLDLGATAKAWAADRCARDVARRCGVGVLVALGGDIATAGPAPDGGWRIRVQDTPGDPYCVVSLPAGGALATSSTVSRQWTAGDTTMHHIVDPRTALPAVRRWRSVSVAAFSCVRANTLSTAALVRGAAAPGWLAGVGAPARLVAVDGAVRTVGGWSAKEEAQR
ncbi:FAD:protein FMN transferase [Micromonospora sp. NBC_01813]|uniref:FAD:protein FMN transferase n=1 Tax=Micromonospora sp. NBC_01813 TaxID=2975988 RepID=UPI002DD7AF18|nr:FAD:protein FMN transferase [Micromonospora sp. NBC_01813]WSA11203.1 FAD:protein FMN transferase [Micromonospora sp. NBC_01813]